MSNTMKKRVELLEDKTDKGLRLITSLAYYYEDTRHLKSSQPYWTDAPIGNIEDLYNNKEYRRVDLKGNL